MHIQTNWLIDPDRFGTFQLANSMPLSIRKEVGFIIVPSPLVGEGQGDVVKSSIATDNHRVDFCCQIEAPLTPTLSPLAAIFWGELIFKEPAAGHRYVPRRAVAVEPIAADSPR